MLECGAYSRFWPALHLMPEETARAHQDLRGEILIPIHWAKFDLRACLIRSDRVFRSATVQEKRRDDDGLAALFRGVVVIGFLQSKVAVRPRSCRNPMALRVRRTLVNNAADWAVPPERREEDLFKHALSLHPWTETIEHLLKAAARLDVTVATPVVGERFVVSRTVPHSTWWSGIE